MKLPEEYQVEFLQTRVEKLEKALKNVLELIGSGWLVRNISKDSDPDWALKQIDPVRQLAEARDLVNEAGI